MPEGLTPRQRARVDSIARIKALALSQLRESAAAELSLRAIARELNLVSSAIYRYFASRDELITALIIDAYDDLATALVAAGIADRRGDRRRWVDVCVRLRAWAVLEPHRFALVYGSAIPGYRAPADTLEPAARVVQAFAAPVVSARRGDTSPLTRRLRTQLASSQEGLGLDVEADQMLAIVEALTVMIGALTLELNGHFVGGFEPADDLFTALIERQAERLGL